MTPARTAARLIALLALLGLSHLGPAGPASAHTSLVSTTPVAGALVGPPPQAVVLTYSKAVSPVLAEVVVTGPDGQQRQAGEPTTSGATVTQPISPPTAAGEYQVVWRVVSDDGHPISGTYAFQVAAPAPPPPAADVAPGPAAAPQAPAAAGAAAGPPAATTLAAPAPPDRSTWLPVLAGLVIASATLALASLLLRRRATSGVRA